MLSIHKIFSSRMRDGLRGDDRADGHGHSQWAVDSATDGGLSADVTRRLPATAGSGFASKRSGRAPCGTDATNAPQTFADPPIVGGDAPPLMFGSEQSNRI